MPPHDVRVIDHHSFPTLLGTLRRAVRDEGGEGVAPLLERSQTLAVMVEDLREAEAILLQHNARNPGVLSVLLSPREDASRKAGRSMVLLGSFQQYLQLTDILREEKGGLAEVSSEIKGAIFRFRERSFVVTLPHGDDLILGPRALIMGIIDATPDSFSDGGENLDPDAAVARGVQMAKEGADILDIGGESTRPGADPVSPKVEQGRVLPVIERLVPEVDIPLSIDTRNGETARLALQAGASMINDVSGLSDPRMPVVAARTGAPIILMHMRGTPADMARHTEYGDLMRDIVSELSDRVRLAIDAGVDESQILVDPGIGFAKTGPQSMETVRRLAELRTLGRPIVVGPSRKSFLTEIAEVPTRDRIPMTLGVIAACISHGARIVRVHDVLETVRAVRAFEAGTP